MPIPFLIVGAAALAGVTGLVKGGQALSNNSKAQELIEEAELEYKIAQDELENQREQLSEDLDKLGETKLYSWSNDIGTFVNLFKRFKKVDIQGDVDINEKLKLKINSSDNFKQMEIASLKANEVVKAGVSALGAGALAGIASYGGAMMFASASTGTAIATLSGAAATNATLAWFGGGSLAAGGLGIAGGTAVLGGIVAGPVLAVAGFIMAAKSEENLAAAEKTYSEAKLAIEKMGIMTDFMRTISNISNEYNSFIIQFSERYQHILTNLQEIHSRAYREQESFFMNKIKKFFGFGFKVDYTKLCIEDQKKLQISWLFTQVLYAVLSAPLLTQEGDLDKEVYNTLNGARETSQKLIGASC